MDLIQLSEQLKGVQDQFLEQQVANPSGTVPPYLVLSELNRRKTLRSQMAAPPVSTVAQDVLQPPPPQGMPGMGGVDMLNQQMPQPQVPQMPQGGMPIGGGLAGMAPPMPQGPPAPRRMAGGGLVGEGKDRLFGRPDGYWGDNALRMAGGGGILNVPPVIDESGAFQKPKPWWQDMLKMYGMTGGLTGLGAPLIAHLLSKWWDKDDDDNGPAAPKPTGMAEGGLVRMQTGGYLDLSNPLGSGGYGGGGYGSSNRRRMNVIRAPDGSIVYEIDGVQFPIEARKPLDFPKYEPRERVTVPRPKLEEFLGEVRAITKDPEGYTSPLDKRISELEEQRGKIRRPTLSQGLFETGLGMLASKSPNMGQALGEAAGSAFGNYMQRREAADKTELGITDRLASVAAQREEQQRRARMEELRAASELASRQYGANMVEAQLEDAEYNRQRTHNLAEYQARAAAENTDLGLFRGLQAKVIEDAMKPPELTWQQRQANELAQIKARADEQIRVDAARPRYGSGYGGYGRAISPTAAQQLGERLIRDQVEAGQWGVGGEDTTATYLTRIKRGLMSKVLTGELYPDVHPQSREAIASGLMNWEPGKTDTTFSTGLAAHVKKGVADALAAGAAATPKTFAGRPASKPGTPLTGVIGNSTQPSSLHGVKMVDYEAEEEEKRRKEREKERRKAVK